MKRFVTAQQMKEIDDYTINNVGIPSLSLMETAGYKTYMNIAKIVSIDKKILIICGNGNNGADGLVCASWLYNNGYDVTVCIINETSKSNEYLCQLNRVNNLGIKIVRFKEIRDRIFEYGVIVDSIFGIGLNSLLREEIIEIVDIVNKTNAIVISVDVPSGINATDGSIMGRCIKADYTITFGVDKVGHNLYPAKDYVGNVIVEDIGFSKNVIDMFATTYYTYNDGIDLLPHRIKNSHKGSYGKILVVAGSKDIYGALYFAAKAAYRAGSGIVYVYTHISNKIAINANLPEAICYFYDDFIDDNILVNLLKDVDACLIGSGIGVSNLSKNMLEIVMKNFYNPIVLDADAINLLDKDMVEKYFKSNMLVTPHPIEFKRLIHKLGIDEKVDKCRLLLELKKLYNLNIVLKDTVTIIAENENNIYLNTTGNSSLAKGGSGDILAGIIASYLGQGIEMYDAMRRAVYFHGFVAQKVSYDNDKGNILPSDILDKWRYYE